jgi:hypothetical protein
LPEKQNEPLLDKIVGKVETSKNIQKGSIAYQQKVFKK